MNECMDGRALLGEAIREEKHVRVCRNHPRLVHFDEPVCPCCKIQAELSPHRWNEIRVREIDADRKRREADRELRRMRSKFTPRVPGRCPGKLGELNFASAEFRTRPSANLFVHVRHTTHSHTSPMHVANFFHLCCGPSSGVSSRTSTRYATRENCTTFAAWRI